MNKNKEHWKSREQKHNEHIESDKENGRCDVPPLENSRIFQRLRSFHSHFRSQQTWINFEHEA